MEILSDCVSDGEMLNCVIATIFIPLLQDFCLELKSGQMTALVGPSGEGKSTCVSLLERFYEPQDGEILLDNEPVKSYDHRFLHEKVIVITTFTNVAHHSSVIFNTSLKRFVFSNRSLTLNNLMGRKLLCKKNR